MKSSKNIEILLRRRSFPEFLEAMKHHVDTKEWSEVGGMLKIARRILDVWDPDIILDVGCGKRPTLATIMALNYKKPVDAIDPELDTSYASNIYNLYLFKKKLEEVEYKGDGRKVLILANHSHVTKKEVKKVCDEFDEYVYITTQCCVHNKLNQASIRIVDRHMNTAKNEVNIFTGSKELLGKLGEVFG